MLRSDTCEYKRLFLEDIPLLDVRAPVEFAQGAFPHSQNIPLLSNEQRQAIGTRYKQSGEDAAIALALKLATPEIRAERLQAWQRFIQAHPQGYLYCFRGGLRSKTTQSWLKEIGVDYPLVIGGYKAMRAYLLTEIEISAQKIPLLLLSGLTGSGKTQVLKQTAYHLDLEGLAGHKGSAFGRLAQSEQPAQIQWENQLAVFCLKFRENHPGAGLMVEDESRKIGRISLPLSWYRQMKNAPAVYLECDLALRIEKIREEYIAQNWRVYQQIFADDATAQFSTFVLGNLERIYKRLGDARYREIAQSLKEALAVLFATGNSQGFEPAIRRLLSEYYDPMYRYQLEKNQTQFVYRGNADEIRAWADDYLQSVPPC